MGTRNLSLLYPFPLLFVFDGDENASPREGLGLDSGRWWYSSFLELRSACRMLGGRWMVGNSMSSCNEREWGGGVVKGKRLTSNDWAYQFLTFLIDGMSLRLWGSSSSSLTRCARRTGSSSEGGLGWMATRQAILAHLRETGSP